MDIEKIKNGEIKNLTYANLRYANLINADLTYANLTGADLRYVDLTGADLDFSCLSLWCGSFNMKVDDRFIYQLICHLYRFNLKNCSEKVKILLNDSNLKNYRNKFTEYRSDIKNV